MEIMDEAIQALHPPRPAASRRRIRRSDSSSIDTVSLSEQRSVRRSSSSGASSTRQRSNKTRFTELLLEHGEKQLNDWAVRASSSSGDGNRASSMRLKQTDGRMRLCTRSVVFEPGHSSKGIVRIPFRFMISCPSLVEGATLSAVTAGDTSLNRDAEIIFAVSSTRHFVMKSNNIICPYEQIQTPTDFRFAFLHSSPSSALALAKALYELEKSSAPSDARFDPRVIENHDVGTNTRLPKALAKMDQKTVLQRIFDPPVEIPFESIHFLHVHEQPLSPKVKCTVKQPLMEHVGILMVTDCGFYFQRFHGGAVTNDGGVKSKPHSFWSIRDMKAIARRYDGLKDIGLEIYLARREGCANKSLYRSVLLSFESVEVRESIVRILLSQKQQDPLICYTDKCFVESALQQWQSGQLDNFTYLLVLNSAAGRTFHDLSRYPVFPWVLSNYSEHDDERYSSGENIFLDLTNENNFRDLSKPIGALNEERFVEFQKRYHGMVQQQNMGQGQSEKQHHVQDSPFMFGTHYSSPAYVLFYLLRVMPEHMLCLQNGKFDVPDRLFHSIDSTFQSVLTNPADVKELIPEFYDPDCFDFLINAMGLQLGNLQSGERVNDVLLPSWAKSAKHFLRLHRAALESDFCTQRLPKWIDLIFGVTSRGSRAKEARNLFHPISYLGPSDLNAIQSEEERNRVELQANEFGIVPDQLFGKEHPPKSASWDSIDGVVLPEHPGF
ncbi:hypothetical protein HJC23_002700 [Cyclotella cryptica]|uniref:BEACH domain-containing protein n=1 Tax=Cyclotella cryptica TaxID=29204 RepID=A0ABD3PAL5_9STRA|eukprot:CCRYP_016033-RA/>CCRYP_016033-RA protein AED:0.01 eAED:0.01 QI:105/1/1/1/1/1/3/5209/722